jgi:hypothetical protein
MMFAAWEVEPDAFWLVNLWVSVPFGWREMNGDPHPQNGAAVGTLQGHGEGFWGRKRDRPGP